MRHHRIMNQRREAFSIKELLVVILIVGTLIALIVPSIVKVRERQARTDSVNNLKNIGLAAPSFHDLNKRLPFNGSSIAMKDLPYGNVQAGIVEDIIFDVAHPSTAAAKFPPRRSL